MADTSLVFNLIARDRASATLQSMREKFDTAATGIGVGVAAALGVGVAASLDMSSANAKLTAQLGVGPAEAAELSKVSANVYTNAWGDSTATVNEAIRGVYQNIGDTDDAEGGLEGLTTKALALSETFDQEVGPTSAAAGQLIRTGLADNADEAFDILTSGFQSSANKADDFLDTINEYSTQFRRLGLDGQTATGLLSQGLKAGARDADQVADAVGQFGELALSGSSGVQQAFKSIGLDADEMSAKIGKGGSSASQALQETLDALRGTSNEQTKLNAATALFGDPGTVMGDALFALDPASAAASSGMDKAAGSADKLVKTMGDTPAKTLESFKREATVQLAEVAGVFIKFGMDNQTVMMPLAYTLGGIAASVLVVRGAMMAWAAAQAVWSAATAIATGAQWLWNAALLASPLTWIVLAIVALVAIIVVIATKTTWFQTLWAAAWNYIQIGFHAAVAGISTALSWFAGLPGLLAGWIGSAVTWAIAKFLTFVSWMNGLPGRAYNAISALPGLLHSRASAAFTSFKAAATTKAAQFLSWASGLPGRIGRAIGSLNNLLVSKGKNVVQGLWNGIQSMGGWLASKITGWAKSVIPGPVAEALGIHSPSRLMADEIGHWIPAGIAMGAENNVGVLDKTMANLVQPQGAAPTTPLTAGMTPLTATQGGGQVLVRFEINGANEEAIRFLRKIVRVTGRGNVQTAFGTGR